jgi:Uma2 family endonuclease
MKAISGRDVARLVARRGFVTPAECLSLFRVPRRLAPFFHPRHQAIRIAARRMMNVQPNLPMDNVTFLDWVQGREERYELAGGRVIMMTDATLRHRLIVGNLFELLRARLDRKQWVVLTEFGIDVRPGTIRYADIVVDRSGGKGDALNAIAPVLIAEVLSPSTMKIDLGDKAADYLQLSSLATYLVIAQDEVKAWAYNRSGEKPFPPGPQAFAGADASVSIPALGIELRLIDIYGAIDFD